MKQVILFIFFLFFFSNIFSQSSLIKAGVNLNSDYVDHKIGKLVYPGFEVNYERILSKKISVSIGYNYAKRNYNAFIPDYIMGAALRSENTDHIIIPEFRYYLESTNEGFFIQTGLPYTVSIETRVSRSPAGSIKSNGPWSQALSCFAGIGIKHSIKSHFGLEMTCNISPSANFLGDLDYGTSGFFKTGLRIYYAF
jgi:hypothetical protein